MQGIIIIIMKCFSTAPFPDKQMSSKPTTSHIQFQEEQKLKIQLSTIQPSCLAVISRAEAIPGGRQETVARDRGTVERSGWLPVLHTEWKGLTNSGTMLAPSSFTHWMHAYSYIPRVPGRPWTHRACPCVAWCVACTRFSTYSDTTCGRGASSFCLDKSLFCEIVVFLLLSIYFRQVFLIYILNVIREPKKKWWSI